MANRMTQRRDFLRHCSVAGLAMSLPLPLLAQSTLSVTDLGANLSVISGAGSSVLVAQSADSVVVVNGGLEQNAAALLAEINRISGNKPVSVLFNTSWRRENCGLNYLVGSSSADIVGHENTRLWQTADFYVEWEDQNYSPMPKQAQINKSFYTQESLSTGGLNIEYGYLPQASTDGDIYVNFADANVLAVGDLLKVNEYPTLDYATVGWVGGMQEAMAALLAMANDDTRIIAQEGHVLNKQDLQAQSDMLDIAREKVGDAFRSGWSVEEFIASHPEADFTGERGDPSLFLTQLYRGTWYHVPGRAVRNVI